MTLMPTQESIDLALDHIHAAMIFADRIFEEEAQDHARDFVWQMRTDVGMPLIAFRDEFVPYETTRSALWLLAALEKIETRLRAVEALVPESESQGRIGDEFRPSSAGRGTPPILPEQAQDKVVLSIAGEKHRLRQRLDKHRQQAAGVTHYIWQTRGDDHVRPEHAANNGKTFRWDDPPPTGHPGEDFGCRCVAIPSPEEVQPPDDPPIEPVYPIEELLVILSRLKTAYKLGKALYDKLTARIRPHEPDLKDTSTWPTPPTDERLEEGTPSRTKPAARGEKSLYDTKGGEWRYAPGDKYHNPHWDYKPGGGNQGWKNIPIDDKPVLKSDVM